MEDCEEYKEHVICRCLLHDCVFRLGVGMFGVKQYCKYAVYLPK